MAATGVPICVEAIQENQIQECRIVERQDGDGQEIQEVYVQLVYGLILIYELFHNLSDNFVLFIQDCRSHWVGVTDRL